ncbi:LmeA family phospholipid-binding protein [Microbacterium sp. YY-01]|uniref:LmeA family phospholipid-binding protein n=1 Tax=Microbacterium sp. YY-01 TaxID=3421634 RepID=UPI003D1684D1
MSAAIDGHEASGWGASQQPDAARRRRWPWVLAIVLVTVVAAAVVGELVARAAVERTIRSEIINALDLPDDQQLQIDMAPVTLLQLASGHLRDLRVESDSVTVGPFTGAAAASAESVPLRGGTVMGAEFSVRADSEQLLDLVRDGAELPIVTDITLADELVTAAGSIDVWGASIPVSLSFSPGADSGDVTITPVSATLGSVTIDAAAIQERLGSTLGAAVATQNVCIADRIPAGIELAKLSVEQDSIQASFTVNPAIADDERLREPGTCEK